MQKDNSAEAVALDVTLADVAATANPEALQTDHTLLGTEADVVTVRRSAESFPVQNWDRYEFIGLIGRGGMGSVYKAKDRRLGRVVALKFIRGDDDVMIRRFVQEARAQSRIDHPGICKVHEVGDVDGKPYIAMQLVVGTSLDRAAQTLSLEEKVQVIRDVALAVHAAHELGIIHRDLKPSNIMIERGKDGERHPIVMDFGLAREAGEGKGLTESGAVMGTPAYMSPEQARGEVRTLDRRTDVYSLGATLFDLLTGRPPFDDETVVTILLRVMTDVAQPLRSVDATLPEALELITSKCLNKEAAQRYATARELAADLDQYLSKGQVSAKRLSISYRLRYWAKHNRSLAALTIALGVALLCLSSFAVYTRITNLRKAREAERQTELARQLGQEVKDLEWFMRVARALPLHDIEKEKLQVQARMADLARRFSVEPQAAAILHYGLGRGHLALHEYKLAHAELQLAESLGTALPELHYALGRVLGELYSQALADARRSGDASFLEKRKKELAAEFLKPALAHLEAVKQARVHVESPHYLEGLIAFYDQHLEEALVHAASAVAQDAWLYEARKLEGDVYFARALEEKDSGRQDEAARDFQEAIRHFEQAAEIGRSDHGIYEDIAESWIRQLEMDVARGNDPQPKHEQALRAADRAILASSKDSNGYTKKAYSYYFIAQYFVSKDEQTLIRKYVDGAIAAGWLSIKLHNRDAHAYEVTGMGYAQKAQSDIGAGDIAAAKKNLQVARELFIESMRIDPKFPWAYNDLATTYIIEFDSDAARGNADFSYINTALDNLKKAIHIDGKYFNAFSNLAAANQLAAKWLVEHGRDPTDAAADAIRSAGEALAINDKFQYALGIIANAYITQAEYNLMQGADPARSCNLAIATLQRAISINKAVTIYYRDIAYAFYMKAKSKPTEEALSLGNDYIQKCYAIDPNFAPCLWTDGLLKSLSAMNGKEHAKKVEVDYLSKDFALAQARRAVAKAQAEDLPEANLALATVVHQRTKSQPAGTKPNVAELDEALAALRRALAVSQGWPRALALQGSLAGLRADQEPDEARHAELVRLAKDSRERAVQGNPLFKP